MGDRAQIAVKHPTKADPNAKVYLYGHWAGQQVFTDLADAIKAGARLTDRTYFTRILAREMGMGADGETGYGIGTTIAWDVEHAVPVVDCEAGTVTFEKGPPDAQDLSLTFAEYVAKNEEGFFDSW